MERTGTLSYMGMYDYDNTLFDNFQIPAGVDKDNLIISLLSECAELEALYPSAPTFKKILGAWSANRLPSWERVKTALEEEYSSIENTNRFEDITDTTDRTESGKENWTDKSNSKTIAQIRSTPTMTASWTTIKATRPATAPEVTTEQTAPRKKPLTPTRTTRTAISALPLTNR